MTDTSENFIRCTNELKLLLRSCDPTLPQKGLEEIIEIENCESNKSEKLDDKQKSLENEIKSTVKCKREISLEIEELQKQLNVKKCELDLLLVTKEQLETQNKSHIKKKNDIQNYLEKDKLQLGTTITSMENSVKLYREIIGLDFKKRDNDTMTFIFRHIFVNNPCRTCTFDLNLKQNVYQVTQCDPDIGDINDIVSTLNETNNFRKFIVTMRKLFLSTETK